jgi:hypothetical protein
MFSRGSCYFFVRPKKSFLELCVFLGRPLQAPQVRRVDRVSRVKLAHFIRITHRDEVEAPITDWLQEAYEISGAIATGKGSTGRGHSTRTTATASRTNKTKETPSRRAPK